MKIYSIATAFAVLLPLGQPVAASPEESVRAAHALCATFDATGLSTDCEVSGWGSRVDVVIDMSSGEARETCRGVSQLLRQRGYDFDSQWKLRIRSPYSDDNAIAECPL